ncbi:MULTISPECIES: isocitrate/isopropylmalate dehydrogenase family protein [Rhizobium]|uniref:3-isopropylmalate dehydrogenase n=1 Tax=Rhizobium fabae TaxID=573179 RepID=A0A7W6B8P3_9HYPH|nr:MULTISPECIES: isocitrate/isopropylmalate dehydrogenase family protein [Rhizobium]MBB3917171.1 3-isopropylmalate dehydrogenase [Rhizobium fabae]PDT27052.1 3-isopropylmalate dehydrogenase [Rhizobium sp. L9]RUM10348.1 isocitrate/isopropylmalate dehydrogenase family protein [Rhizobium fabae]
MSSLKNSFKIAVLPGDGIGREVMPACLEVIDAAVKVAGAPPMSFETHQAGAQFYAESGEALPASALEACRKADAILFGAMGWPDIRFPDGTEIIPQLDLRMEFGLFAGVRPIRWFPGLPKVLSDPRAEGIDFVLIREQTEGLFYARGRGEIRDDQEAYDTMQITRAGTERVTEFAFQIAAQRKRRGRPGVVTCVDKANVFSSMAFFRKIFDEVAEKHPDVQKDYAYVDALALNMVKKPWALDVLVTENMFGDILSDLAAGLIGGMGMAASADIGEHYGLFQPAHGTAPDIAGKGVANPSAMILSGAMMLDWLAVKHREPKLADAARLIEAAVEHTLSTKTAVPMEYGGGANCADMTRSVIGALGAVRKEVA